MMQERMDWTSRRRGVGECRSGRRGMTLMEVLVVIVMLGIALGPLLTTVRETTHEARRTRGRALAHLMACAMLERYRLEPAGVLAAKIPTREAGAALVAVDGLLALGPGPEAELPRAMHVERSIHFEPAHRTTHAGVLVARVDWREDARTYQEEIGTLVCDPSVPPGERAEGDWEAFKDAFVAGRGD